MTLAQDRSWKGAKAPREIRVAHKDDPYTWALDQAELLRGSHLDLIDTTNLADEIAALAHYLADKLRSDLARVLQHLLKWDHQPERRSRSWALSIEEHRRRVAEHLQDGPGLRSILSDTISRAYADGRSQALQDTHLPIRLLPEICPYSWDDIMSRPIDWPEEP